MLDTFREFPTRDVAAFEMDDASACTNIVMELVTAAGEELLSDEERDEDDYDDEEDDAEDDLMVNPEMFACHMWPTPLSPNDEDDTPAVWGEKPNGYHRDLVPNMEESSASANDSMDSVNGLENQPPAVGFDSNKKLIRQQPMSWALFFCNAWSGE